MLSPFVIIFLPRRQIRVDKALVHKNFTDSMNDIALLRLGKDGLSGDPFS